MTPSTISPTSTHREEEIYDVPPTTPSVETDPPQLKFSMTFQFCEFAQFQISNFHPLTESHLLLMDYFRNATAEVTLICDVPPSLEKRDKLDQLLNELESGLNSSHPLKISMSLPITQLAQVPPPLPEKDYLEVESEEDVDSEESEEEDDLVTDLRDIEELSNELTSNQKGTRVYLAVSGANVLFQSDEFGDQKETLYFDCLNKKTRAKILDFELKVPLEGERPLIEFEGKSYRPIESLNEVEEKTSGDEESDECVVSESMKDGEASSEVITLEQLIGDQEGSELMHGNMFLFNRTSKALAKRKPKRFSHMLGRPIQKLMLFHLLPFMTTEMFIAPESRLDTKAFWRIINGYKASDLEKRVAVFSGHASSSSKFTTSQQSAVLWKSTESVNLKEDEEISKPVVPEHGVCFESGLENVEEHVVPVKKTKGQKNRERKQRKAAEKQKREREQLAKRLEEENRELQAEIREMKTRFNVLQRR